MKNMLLSALLLSGLLAAIPAEAAQRALLIGVGDYQRLPYDFQRLGRSLTDLQGPPNDVRLLKEVLVSRYGFAPEAIRTLIDNEATRQTILDAIEHWLIGGTKAGDQVVLFFSGHGVQIPDQNGDEEDRHDEALVAFDLIPEGVRTPEEAGLIPDRVRMKDRYHAFHEPRLDPDQGRIVMAKVFPFRAGTEVTVPDERMKREEFEFEFRKPAGEETVKLIATTRPLDLTPFGLNLLREAAPAAQDRTRSIMAVKAVKEQIDQQSATAAGGRDRFEWSETTVVVRSHEE